MQGLRIASLVIVHVLIIAHIYIFGEIKQKQSNINVINDIL